MTTTLILGASDNPMRFSNRAQKKLTQFSHSVVLVNPKGGTIDGVDCLKSLTEVGQPVDTVTVYINPKYIMAEIQAILTLKPRRVIFNPGSESQEAAKMLSENDIEVIQDCTLIMLDGGYY